MLGIICQHVYLSVHCYIIVMIALLKRAEGKKIGGNVKI